MGPGEGGDRATSSSTAPCCSSLCAALVAHGSSLADGATQGGAVGPGDNMG